MRRKRAPVFLSVDAVLQLHQFAVEVHGGAQGLRDIGALESAVMQPQSGFGDEYHYAFPYGMATTYVYGIAKNHPFVDGNKRAATAAMGAFLEINGVRVGCSDADLVGAVLALVTNQLTRRDFERWLGSVCT